MIRPPAPSIFFFFNDTATTEIYTLSLHDALPISPESVRNRDGGRSGSVPAGNRTRGVLLQGSLTVGAWENERARRAAPFSRFAVPYRLRRQGWLAGHDVGDDLARREVACVALPLGDRHHRRDAARRDVERDISEPPEAAGVD